MRIKKSMSMHIQKSKLERASFNLHDDAVAWNNLRSALMMDVWGKRNTRSIF
jgi:hypothetical protein